jgi:hypothetical protein
MKVMKRVSLSTMTVPPPEYLLTIGIESLQEMNQMNRYKAKRQTFLPDQYGLIQEFYQIIQ